MTTQTEGARPTGVERVIRGVIAAESAGIDHCNLIVKRTAEIDPVTAGRRAPGGDGARCAPGRHGDGGAPVSVQVSR